MGIRRFLIPWVINTRKLNFLCQCSRSLCHILFRIKELTVMTISLNQKSVVTFILQILFFRSNKYFPLMGAQVLILPWMFYTIFLALKTDYVLTSSYLHYWWKKLIDESLGKNSVVNYIACKRSFLLSAVNRRTIFFSFSVKFDYALWFANSSVMISNKSHYLLNKKSPWNVNFPLDTSKGYFNFIPRVLRQTIFCR